MILLAILGFIIPLFLGFSIVNLFFKEFDIYERAIASVAVGIGVFTYFFFILNQFFSVKFNFFNGILFAVSMFILAVLFLFVSKRCESDTNKLKHVMLKKHTSIYDEIKSSLRNVFKEHLTIKIIMFFMIVLIIYKSLFFPIINGDGLGFHAPMMKEIFETGELSKDVGPNTVEFTRAYSPTFFIFGAWMSILNQEFTEFFVKILPLFFGFLLLLTVYILAKNIVFKDKSKALFACFLLMTFPMFVNQSVYLNNDTMFAFFAVATAYFIMRYIKEKNYRYLVLSFLILGLSINVKQLGIPFFISVFIPLCFILFYKKIVSLFKHKINIKNFFMNKELKIFLFGIMLFLLIITPYFLRNYLFFNDPVYPYLSGTSFFHGKNFVPFLYAPLVEAYTRFNII